MDESKILDRVSEILYELDTYSEQGHFVYNSKISLLIDELELIRKNCHHEYFNGECVYCLRKEV